MRFFATLSCMKEKEFMEISGIPENHIFSSRDLSFSGTNRVSPGSVVSVSVPGTAGILACVAPFGSSKIHKTGFSRSKLEMDPFYSVGHKNQYKYFLYSNTSTCLLVCIYKYTIDLSYTMQSLRPLGISIPR